MKASHDQLVRGVVDPFGRRVDGRRLNCAEALDRVFAPHLGLEANPRLGDAGKGMAPGGICGAAYAARALLVRCAPDRIAAFDRSFELYCGAMQCSDIRRIRRSSCRQCVAAAAGILAGLVGPTTHGEESS